MTFNRDSRHIVIEFSKKKKIIKTKSGEHKTTPARGRSRFGWLSIVIPDTLLESYSQNDKYFNQRHVYYKIRMILKKM